MKPNLSARSNLGLTFGTKKSRKTILSYTENAISPSKPRSKNDALADALISNVSAATASMPTRAELQAEINEGKPIPEPNLDAESVEEVYTLESLVGGTQMLRRIEVQSWISTVESGGEVKTRSRFVAKRLAYLVQAEDIKRLRGLKYLLLLVELYHSLIPNQRGNGSMRMPKKEELASKMPDWPSELLESLRTRFAEADDVLNKYHVNNMLSKWHVQRLLTHILALALVVDGFVTDVKDIKEDLKLEMKDVSALYKELAAPLMPPTEGELKRLRMSRTEAMQDGHRFARLRLPLQFPKMRVMNTRR